MAIFEPKTWPLALDAGPLLGGLVALLVAVLGGLALRQWLAIRQESVRKGAPGPTARPGHHLLERLQKLHARGDGDRFAQTCDWILRTQGPELLNWMRHRAEAEGRTGLAARLAKL